MRAGQYRNGVSFLVVSSYCCHLQSQTFHQTKYWIRWVASLSPLQAKKTKKKKKSRKDLTLKTYKTNSISLLLASSFSVSFVRSCARHRSSLSETLLAAASIPVLTVVTFLLNDGHLTASLGSLDVRQRLLNCMDQVYAYRNAGIVLPLADKPLIIPFEVGFEEAKSVSRVESRSSRNSRSVGNRSGGAPR